MRGTTLKSEKDEKHDALLSEIDTLRQMIDACFTEEEAYAWLFLPQENLGGKCPIVMIAKGQIGKLNDRLDCILSGNFS